MIFDLNAWLGNLAFRQLTENTPQGMLARMDRHGIQYAAVSSLEAMLHRNVQLANEKLAEDVAPYGERLFPLATINPTYVRWEDDLAYCHEKLGMRGVRLHPQYHGYTLAQPIAKSVATACRERNLPVFIAHRIEDSRQRHALDPGKTVEFNEAAQLLTAVPGLRLVLTNARGSIASSRLMQPDLINSSWFLDLSLAEVLFTRVLYDLAEKTGGQHLVFGTHAPISYAACALVKLALLPLENEQLELVKNGNATTIMGLSKDSGEQSA